MAFKKLTTYNQERSHNWFTLRNDGDSANVTFLYHSIDDVLVAEAHYLNSNNYSGYVHCCGKGCPACAAGIRTQRRIFLPVFNFDTRKIEFFDRSTFFESQLVRDVFDKFPDPSKIVFKVTRHGKPNDVNTTYSIEAIGKNKTALEDILANEKVSFPEHYSTVIKEVSVSEMANILSNRNEGGSTSYDDNDLPDYTITPRGQSTSSVEVNIPFSEDTSQKEEDNSKMELTDEDVEF